MQRLCGASRDTPVSSLRKTSLEFAFDLDGIKLPEDRFNDFLSNEPTRVM